MELLEDPHGTLDIATVSQPPASTGFVAGTPATANVVFAFGVVGSRHPAQRGR